MSRSRRRSPASAAGWALVAAAAAVVAALLLWEFVIADAVEDGGRTPPVGIAPGTPRPTEAATPSPEATPTATPTASPGPSGPRLLYREFGERADVIWAAYASAPDTPVELARVDHFPLFGIAARASADGTHIAYTVLPPDLQHPDPFGAANNKAQLWVLTLASGERRMLSESADLRLTPLWAPDGSTVIFRRLEEDETGAVRAELLRAGLDGTVTSLLARAGVRGLTPVGFSPDGSLLYVVEETADGEARVLALEVASGATSLVTAVPIPVDLESWQLSPDGRFLAMIDLDNVEGRPVRHLKLLALADAGTLTTVETGAPGLETLSPVWRSDGPLALGRAPAAGPQGVLLRAPDGAIQELAPPEVGFDAPRAWSPDGAFLAVLTFSEYPVQRVGRPVIVGLDGTRNPLVVAGEVTILGWSTDGD